MHNFLELIILFRDKNKRGPLYFSPNFTSNQTRTDDIYLEDRCYTNLTILVNNIILLLLLLI